MFSLLSNKIETPSYKRGLALNSSMLIFYGIAFQLNALESLAPDILTIFKYISLALAIVISFRAMAERRVLYETQENYLSMIDKSVIPTHWQVMALGSWAASGAIVYMLFLRGADVSAVQVLTFGLPIAAFIMAAAYAIAAKNWRDETH